MKSCKDEVMLQATRRCCESRRCERRLLEHQVSVDDGNMTVFKRAHTLIQLPEGGIAGRRAMMQCRLNAATLPLHDAAPPLNGAVPPQ